VSAGAGRSVKAIEDEVGSTRNIERAAAQVGQILRSGDRTDIAFLAAGIATGLLAGLLSVKVACTFVS
jgi:hypothetical protein